MTDTPPQPPKQTYQVTNSGAGCIGCLGIIIVIVIIAAISAAIGGASGSSSSTEATTVQQEVVLTDEERFLAQARVANSALSDVPDASLLSVGRVVCSDLGAGTPIDEVILNAYLGAVGSGDLSDADAQRLVGAVAGAAVYELCPAYVSELEAFRAQL